MQDSKQQPENNIEEVLSENMTDEQAQDKANEEEIEEVKLSETEQQKIEIAELKDKYLRLFSEFDNHKKRTSKEKIEFFKTANEDLMSALIPVLDDFERAQKSITPTTELGTVLEGMNLIHNKLLKTLENKGLKPMNTEAGKDFDTELHEAITQFPAPSEALKGKVIDTAEKGYFLNDKVVRFAKVIIGS